MKLYLYPKSYIMNNATGNATGNVTALLTAMSGIFGMENKDFNPAYGWFYFVIVAMVAFVLSFIAEAIQDETIKFFNSKRKKPKHKNEIRLGNRHF